MNEWTHIDNVAFVVIYSKTRFVFKCDFVALVLMFLWIMPHVNLEESCGQLYLVLDSLAFHEFVQCRYRLYMDENQDGVAEQDIYPGFDDLTCFL